MKYLIGSCFVFLALLLTSIFFPFKQSENSVSYDDEQEGLSEQIVITFSHVVAENTPKGLAAKKFAELAAEKTNGLVKVEVVPNGALYTDQEELDALMNNNVQMIAPSISKMTGLTHEWGIFDLPFLFENKEDMKTVLSSDLGKKLLRLNESENIKGMSLWSNGFKQMSSNVGPLREPKDFMNQRFRTMTSETIEEQFRLLGARPIPLPFDQVYVSLEQEKFDGQENTISNIYSRRLYELQSHLTISNHGFLGYAVLMNKDFWEELPEDIQISLTEAMEETTLWMLDESSKMNREQLDEIEQKSTIEIYHLTPEQKKEWIRELLPVYKSFLEGVEHEFIKEYTIQRLKQLEANIEQ